MSKRLQILLDEAEYRELRRLAKHRHVTVAAFVREAIRSARGSGHGATAGDKLRIVRAGASHAFPTAEVDQMLAEIERGYRQ